MSSKLNLSEENSEKLDDLSRKLGLRRNIVCRIAIGRSVGKGKLENITLDDFMDNKGYEFNRYTLTGEFDDYFKALIIQAQQKKLNDNEYFKKYLRKHIERGIRLMHKEYQRVGSKTTYLKKLAEGEKLVES